MDRKFQSGAYSGVFLFSGGPSDGFGRKACASRDFILDHGCARIPVEKCDKYGDFAYFDGSCWGDKAITLLDWKQSPLVLKSEEVTANRVDLISEALIYRHFQLYDRVAMKPNDFENPVYSFYRGIGPQMLFNDSILEKIVLNGFLNQHRTHSSGAIFDEKLHWKAEEQMFDVVFPHDNPEAADIAPKYLYGIQTEDFLNEGNRVSYWASYGNVLAVFDATKIKNRITITLGDSLALFGNGHSNRLNTMKYVTDVKEDLAGGAFIEAQIWGKLDLTYVERLLVNCPKVVPVSPERIAEIYRLTHIPVYTCKVEKVGVSEHYIPDVLIAGKEGDSFRYP